jgi:glutamyl-tRNA synthetase
MHWLGLDYDEGPIYQMQRLDRYREVIAQMRAAGTGLPCYMTPAELDAMREAADARATEKRATTAPGGPSRARRCRAVPEGVQPVVRFKQSARAT